LSTVSPNNPCPCESGKKYKKCCRPYHMGMTVPSPEALMRSRYTAYAIGHMRYIMNTTHPQSEWHQNNSESWLKELTRLTHENNYLGLTISETTFSDDGTVGWVTFTAKITQNGEDISFTEKSRFEKHNNQWMYLSGEITSA